MAPNLTHIQLSEFDQYLCVRMSDRCGARSTAQTYTHLPGDFAFAFLISIFCGGINLSAGTPVFASGGVRPSGVYAAEEDFRRGVMPQGEKWRRNSFFHSFGLFVFRRGSLGFEASLRAHHNPHANDGQICPCLETVCVVPLRCVTGTTLHLIFCFCFAFFFSSLASWALDLISPLGSEPLFGTISLADPQRL